MEEHDSDIFQDSWLSESAFNWLKRAPNDIHSAACEVCDGTFSISTNGRQAILDHMKAKKHKENAKKSKYETILSQFCVIKPPPAAPIPHFIYAASTHSAIFTIPQSEVANCSTSVEFSEELEDPTNEKTSDIIILKTYEEAKDRILQHEISTVTKYIVMSTPYKEKSFQNEIQLSSNSKLRWHNNVPYFHFGRERRNCHLGYDKAKSAKRKYAQERDEKVQMGQVLIRRKRKLEETKKKNCPATVSITRVYLMPQHKMMKDNQWQKSKLAAEIKKKITSGEHIPGEEAFFLYLPDASDHQFHVLGKVASVIEPLDPRVRHKIEDIVISGEIRLDTVQALLYDFVSNELNEKDQTRRRFYPLKKLISQIMTRTKRNIRTSRMNMENTSIMIQDWNLSESTIFFRPSGNFNDDFQNNSADVLEEQTDGNYMVFVYQNAEMKHLYQRYAKNCVFLDAPYRALNYAVPVYFLVVKTNIDFQIVALIITECETANAISEGLDVVRQWNPQIIPTCAVVDFAYEEINALENIYEGIEVYICSMHREKAWNKWFKKRINSSIPRKEGLDYMRNIANAYTEEQLWEAIKNLKFQSFYGSLKDYFEGTWLPEVRRWAVAFKSGDCYLHTNKGTKVLNEELRYNKLEGVKNCMLSELIQHLVSKFLPELYIRYTEGNSQIPSLYKTYKEVVPFYLHNRPKWLIDHVLSKMSAASAEFQAVKINIRPMNIIEVISKNMKYQVEISRSEGWVKCCCASYIKTRLACKHVIMAGMKYKNFNMASISNWLFSNPIFCIDNSYLPAMVQIKREPMLESVVVSFDDFDIQQEVDHVSASESAAELKLQAIQKKDLVTECRSNLKSIQSLLGNLDLYTLTNLSQVLTGVVHQLQSKITQDT